ncbi:MAG: leucyl aminopeptidase family protein [Cyanobacteria bacterium P01_F01_bin.42]
MTSQPAIPVSLITSEQLDTLTPRQLIWAEASGFKAKANSFCLLPSEAGGIERVLVGYDGTITPWTLGAISAKLPPHHYCLDENSDGTWTARDKENLALGWWLGQYKFSAYREKSPDRAQAQATLTNPAGVNQTSLRATCTATRLVRDLINTPANDMGPAQLEAQARTLAQKHDAEIRVIEGDALLDANYPMIHAVGRASDNAPRLIDITWGDPSAVKVTLVGKGVCFDSGGLDLKPASGMLKMKKDMGGAAHVLGVASIIMELKLPLRLRVLIPAVENSVSGSAMRPLDILRSRKGLTVEVGNTDAEGRLVLADALWEAASEDPALIIDFATLTGAARVALGAEVPAVFCNQPDLVVALMNASAQSHDPLWNLPLHKPYRSLLDSKTADLSNVASGSYGGAITAALFLQEFVQPDVPWIHIDVMAWNLRSRPGRPEGGEAMGMRAIATFIQEFVAKKS